MIPTLHCYWEYSSLWKARFLTSDWLSFLLCFVSSLPEFPLGLRWSLLTCVPLWLHIHMVLLCLFPFELHLNFCFEPWSAFWLLVVIGYQLDLQRDKSEILSVRNRRFFPKTFQKFARTFRISHRLSVCDCRGMKVAIPDDRIVVSHLIWRVWLFCPQVRLQGLEVIGLKRRPDYNHIMWTNWIQSNWRWCHPVSLWITWTAPLISVQRLSHSSPLEIVCLLGKPTLMHWAIGVSIKQHNGNPANDRLTNIVKKTIQTKKKNKQKKQNTTWRKPIHQVWLPSFIMVTTTSITSQSHSWLYVGSIFSMLQINNRRLTVVVEVTLIQPFHGCFWAPSFPVRKEL